MKLILILLLIFLGGTNAPTQDPSASSGAASSQTVITSDSLDLNLGKSTEKKQGIFRGNVKVDEPRFTMSSKEMTVFFADDDSVQEVEAREDVVIKRKDGSSEAISEKAVYNMKEKKLTLLKVTKQPRVVSQDKTVFADKIILYPEKDEMLAEGANRVMLQKAP